MPLRLFVARGNNQGQTFIAVQPLVLIGRDTDCDVVLSDAGVSSKHVRIAERDGRYFAADLQSSNGTLLNGAPLLAADREISSGDALGIGTAVVQLTVLDVPDLSSKKRLVPSGVPVASRSETYDGLPRAGDDEATLPIGKPLPNDGPIDRKKYESDPERTVPLAPVKLELSVPPPPLPAPPATLSHAHALPTQQAQALFPVPERERDTAVQAPLEPADPRDKPTAQVPSLPPSAEPMTTVDLPLAPSAEGEPTRAERAPAGLVPAGEVLRRAPDPSEIATRLAQGAARGPLEEPSGAAPRPEAPTGESAAERARRRRQVGATLGGQLRWYWGELDPRVRLGIMGFLFTAAALTGFGLWRVFRPEPGRALPEEPTVLTPRPIAFSFGYGDADYEHVDFKELKFEVKAATPAAVMVHYRAQEIGHEEVSVSVNGHEAGFVAADVGTPERELETLLSQFDLQRDATNVVLFDNVKNPPGRERWQVSHLWMELIPVPEATPEQALAAAREAQARAQLLEKQRAAGDDTLFKLWRTYRQGWIALLALREEDRTWLFKDLKRRAEAARAELDVQCGTLMLEAKKQIELKNPEGAKELLEGVSRWFPTRDHPCPALAEEKLREYDL